MQKNTHLMRKYCAEQGFILRELVHVLLPKIRWRQHQTAVLRKYIVAAASTRRFHM